ncbi:uncharacterized protein LOC108676271 [Hyalella azteca]|uniref:Uncharacterized protein LOC108676271 n=1 Tax=Hyalella azteca TaxID=294128 RepID=A0A8B7P457_HYAAZ|nr:uncharacterized protein LOC108676271 [Hyalella azteca]XP_018019836.1 uncharacterized protein LOC108676271 [Hyalella azteca]
MSRGLVLFIVAAAAASAQAAYSACYLALSDARNAVEKTASPACSPQYTADIEKFMANPNCSYFAKLYDAATCDPIVARFSKCMVKAAKLLQGGNTFNDAAFKATTLLNKCSADAKFIAAYPTCKNSTMKYMNLNRLFQCLMKAVY